MGVDAVSGGYLERPGSDSGLAQWILNQVQPEGTYATLRQFALACGLNQGTLNQIVDGGGPKADTLRKMGEATGESLLDLYIIAGWLTEEEVKGVPKPQMTQLEVGLLCKWRDLNKTQRDAMTLLFESWRLVESRQDQVSEHQE